MVLRRRQVPSLRFDRYRLRGWVLVAPGVHRHQGRGVGLLDLEVERRLVEGEERDRRFA